VGSKRVALAFSSFFPFSLDFFSVYEFPFWNKGKDGCLPRKPGSGCGASIRPLIETEMKSQQILGKPISLA